MDTIIKLNIKDRFNEAKIEIDSQGHSGISFSIIKAMLSLFHTDGENFINALNND